MHKRGDVMIKQLMGVFGDSILKGVIFDSVNEKYRNLSDTPLEELSVQFDFDLINRSRFGSTIQKGVETVRLAVEKFPEMRFAILEFGGNDCDFLWDQVAEQPQRWHEPKTPLPLFIKLYKELLTYLKSKDILPIMMNLPPVDGERYLAFLGSRGLSTDAILKSIKTPDQISRFQELYSINVERIAYETNTLLVDCRSLFLDRKNIKETIGEDGIHPSAEGYQLINRSFLDFMAKLPDDLRQIVSTNSIPRQSIQA